MAGNCGCGGRVSPRISDAPCSALTNTPDGLLVPRTAVEGLAPGTAVGTGRSVDIDVTAPAPGDCPATWTVGARLTPVLGEAFGGDVRFDNKPAADTAWYDVPGMSVTLPEAGVYAVVTEVAAQAAALPNLVITIQQQVLVNGVLLPGSSRTVVQHGQAGAGGPSVFTAAFVGRTARHFVTAAGGEVVTVQVRRLSSQAAAPHPGVLVTGVIGAGGTRIEYVKVAD